jgi:hypothetical protein
MKSFFSRLLERILPNSHEAGPVLDKLPRLDEARPIQRRVSMIIHNPLLEAHSGTTLSRYFGWHDPDTLARQYIADLRECSNGVARYELVERHEIDGYPAKVDGFRYDDATYLNRWQQGGGFHQPDAVDYGRLIQEFSLLTKVERGEIDEVWLFAFPYAGYYESTMAGKDAFWCNAPPVPGTNHCNRRFVLMGFNYERDVGCMLENFGHRAESIMQFVYRHHAGQRNLWERFMRYDKIAPGQAECGNMHFAPNSVRDYDWGNTRKVPCFADNWYHFPDLEGEPRPMNCRDWGGGDMRAHHMWWLDHLPRVGGITESVGNNWWQYILDPDTVII